MPLVLVQDDVFFGEDFALYVRAGETFDKVIHWQYAPEYQAEVDRQAALTAAERAAEGETALAQALYDAGAYDFTDWQNFKGEIGIDDGAGALATFSVTTYGVKTEGNLRILMSPEQSGALQSAGKVEGRVNIRATNPSGGQWRREGSIFLDRAILNRDFAS